MHIISRKALRTYWERYPKAKAILEDWFRKVKGIEPKNLAELKLTFPSTDIFGDCYVFNVGGNNYRVIAHIDFRGKRLFIRAVLSHIEYDRERWKSDC